MTVEIWDVLQILTPIAVGVVGWGVRLVWSEIKSWRDELREYVRQETCKAHRADIQRQLADLRKGGGE